MAKLTERLTQKAGPLPVWGWSVIIGGVFAIVIYVRNKKAASSSADTTSADNTAGAGGISDADLVGGDISAAYDVYNEMGKLNSTNATLATNVGANTTALNQLPTKLEPVVQKATEVGTQQGINAGKPYTVVDYGGEIFELGKLGGARLNTAQYQKTGVMKRYVNTPLVEFLGTYYQLGKTRYAGSPPLKAGPQVKPASWAKGMKVTVVTPTTNVNVAPSKVRS